MKFLQVSFLLLFNTFSVVYAQHKSDKLDSIFSALANKGDFNGTVLVAEEGKPIFNKSFGYADLATKRPFTGQTMFELASVSKQFTSMAIMQLQEKDLLSYEDQLDKYFPKLKYPGVTVKNLLQHTSGIPEFLGWGDDMLNTSKINYSPDVLDALIKNYKPAAFKSGDAFSYSNTNYVLLALIVEKVSHQTFANYLQKHIFDPLGMTRTKVYARRAAATPMPDYALSYIYDGRNGNFVEPDNLATYKYVHYMDGVAGPYGISSTAEDLLKWDQALNTEKLISRLNQEQAYSPAKLNDGKVGKIGNMPYGFGWIIFPFKPGRGRVLMHTGGYPGYQSLIMRFPDKDKTIIMLMTKWNMLNIYELAFMIENILFDRPYEMPQATLFKKSIYLNPVQASAIQGEYVMTIAPQVKITISTELDRVYAQLTGQPKAEIFAESETDFFYTQVSAKIKFFKDEHGEIKRMVLYQNGREFEARK